MNQQQLQQEVEQAVKVALGDLSLQLIVSRTTQGLLEKEVQELKTKLSKYTAGSEAEKEKEP